MTPYLEAGRKESRARIVRDILRDIGLLFAVIMASVSVIIQSGRVDDAEKGRAIALDVNCAAISSLIEGGRTAINKSAARAGDKIVGDVRKGEYTVISGELSKFLEAHGMPGPVERVRHAKAAAAAYALDTAAGIAAASNRIDLVKPNGSLDCDRLRLAAKVGEK